MLRNCSKNTKQNAKDKAKTKAQAKAKQISKYVAIPRTFAKLLGNPSNETFPHNPSEWTPI